MPIQLQCHCRTLCREIGVVLLAALVVGGAVEHALERTSWAELYGSLVDRFGVRWMINLAAEQE